MDINININKLIPPNQMKKILKKNKPRNPKLKISGMKNLPTNNKKLKRLTTKKVFKAKDISIESRTYFGDKQYVIQGKEDILGSGGFGKVYKGEIVGTGEFCAIKLIYSNKVNPDEKLIMQMLNFETGFSKLLWHGKHENFDVLVMELLGSSIGSLFKNYQLFSPKTILKVAIQVLSRLQSLHSNGYIHQDLNFNNLLIGVGNLENTVHLIDFGLAVKLETMPVTPFSMAIKTLRSVPGTPLFASKYAHLGRSPARRDDLISLGYVLLKMSKGKLPWERMDNPIDATDLKLNISVEDLCKGLPFEFVQYFNHCFELIAGEEPNYEYLKNLFTTLALKCELNIDEPFEWANTEGGSGEIKQWYQQ